MHLNCFNGYSIILMGQNNLKLCKYWFNTVCAGYNGDKLILKKTIEIDIVKVLWLKFSRPRLIFRYLTSQIW
jgi:hypothetical protein